VTLRGKTWKTGQKWTPRKTKWRKLNLGEKKMLKILEGYFL
jgi:hypothetical protein